jgi:hypothetical protein
MTTGQNIFKMLVTFASEVSPDHEVNEDLVIAGEDFVVVLDGASHAPGVQTGCIHDVSWLVRQLGSKLADQLLNRSNSSLPDVLAAAIARVRDEHAETCDLDNPDSPSSTVAMLRKQGDVVEYLVLADSPIVLRMFDESVIPILDERTDGLPGYTREIVRNSRNAENGFWVASTNADAAYQAVTGTAPINMGELQSVGLFTDGVSRLVTRYDFSWAELMHMLESPDGAWKVIQAVREADTKDDTAPERGKRHDDATAVLCRFPSSAYGRAQAMTRLGEASVV